MIKILKFLSKCWKLLCLLIDAKTAIDHLKEKVDDIFIVFELDSASFDPFFCIFTQLHVENMSREIILNLLISYVNAKLFKTICLEVFKSIDV